MRIGTLIDMLISIKDDYDLMSCERLAINEACNLLEDLPQGKEATELTIADVGGGK